MNGQGGSIRRWLVLSLLTLVLGLGALGGGYALGRSSGEDLEAARLAGARAGEEEGTTAGVKRGRKAGLRAGRREGYRTAYRRARDR